MLSRILWSGLAIGAVLITIATLWMDDITLERVILIADMAILIAIVWGIYREEKHHAEEMTLFRREVQLMEEENNTTTE